MNVSIPLVPFLITIATSTWIFFDANKIGFKKGQFKGVCNMGPIGWSMASLLGGIFWFPIALLITVLAYFIIRPNVKRVNSDSKSKENEKGNSDNSK